MARLYETLNGGEIEAGLRDGNIVTLGDLPLITTVQFIGFATLALTEGVIPQLDSSTRQDWHDGLNREYERIKDMRERRYSGKFFGMSMSELLNKSSTTMSEEDQDELAAAISLHGEDFVYYAKTPFSVQEDSRRVAFQDPAGEIRHIVDHESFFNLTYDVIRGGMDGWRSGGVPPEIKTAAAQLIHHLQQS